MGFIGSNFIKFLLERKSDRCSIVNLDAISYGANPGNLPNFDNSRVYHFVRGSTADGQIVHGLIKDSVDIVVNFAAQTHVDRSIADPSIFFESNTKGTMTLLEEARKANVRFIQISTDEVYGSALNGYRFTETDRLTPSSPYAGSKAAADLMVECYNRTYGLDTIILRCTNNLGPNQFPEKFIPKTIISGIIDRNIPIYGNGMQIRDWIYVRDFCQAIELAMKNGSSGTIYNVSANNELPNLEVAKLILRRLNKPESLIQFVEDRPGHDIRYSLDSTKARNELGWRPTKPFNEALNETIDWYVKNEEWWRHLLSDRTLSATPWKKTENIPV
jgi:dTDP-glucose 4,6-dehydratase